MKIGVVHVNTEAASGPYTELITANLERAKADDTEIMHRYVGHLRRATDTAIAYPTLLNKVDVVAEMVRLEADGVDAVMVACSGDTGVAEARSLLQIPVVGPMEAAMGSPAGTAGGSGSSPSRTRPGRRTWSRWSTRYGFSARYAGLRQLETPTAVMFTEGFEDPEIVRADIVARARELVDARAPTAILHRQRRAQHVRVELRDREGATDPEVPIFDVISVGLKFAELRAELQQPDSASRRSAAPAGTREFTAKDRERVDKLFGWTIDPATVTS